MQFTREQIGWLRTLVSSHRELQGKLDLVDADDEDPTATAEMYREVESLADLLDAHLDLQDQLMALPTEEEIDAMARDAGADIPF